MATLECPFCYEILEVKPPDRLHSAFSFTKPMPKSYHEKCCEEKLQMPESRVQKTNYNFLVCSA